VGWLDKAAFSPDTLPDDLVIGLALTPPVIAGLVIFKVAAVEMLVVALVIGIAAQVAARVLFRKFTPRPESSPFIAALVGVALVGPGAPLLISVEIAVLAVVLELVRSRYAPAVHAHPGLIAYALVALATRGAPFAYINPANGLAFRDPVAIWMKFFSPGAAPIDPIRLYVGNVAGPVFATSLMAVAVGVAWLAYAKRLSPIVATCFLLGAIIPIAYFHWDFVFQLDSGPTWFVGALILSDRRLLPTSWAARPILGFTAGLIGLGLRSRGYGIEAVFFTVAALQALVGLVVIATWSIRTTSQRRERSRLLRRREEQLRAINRTEEPADPSAVA
jgi:NQR2/RnfD/RnfE family subunit of NADH-ubiquinone oxidoreductase